MLTLDDRRKLINLLVNSRLASSERITATMVEAGLSALLPQIDLDGPPLVVAPLLVDFLENYGRVSYEHHALGRFLSVTKDYVGLQNQAFLEDILSRYQLMVPAIKAPETDRWEKPVTSQDYLEKIIGENTLRPIAYLQMALIVSRPVAYIEVRHPTQSWWSGTGFMVSPSLLLTNNHVIGDADITPRCIFRFNYQEDVAHNPEVWKDYCAKPGGIFYTNPNLDYTLIELDGCPGDTWGYLRIASRLPETEQRVNIIQHPNGLPKQISMQNNFVKFVSPTKLHYITSTLPGSSGSPVFNDLWEVVGLHHAGGDLPEVEGGPRYFRNEGIAIQAILKDLPAAFASQFTQIPA